MTKPTICIDFDGVIHSYEKGWQDGTIYGTIVPGFLEWAAQACKHFKLAVYSSRSKDAESRTSMMLWLHDEAVDQGWHSTPSNNVKVLRLLEPKIAALVLLEFVHEKPAAWLTIDDRCVRFDGSWDSPLLHPAALLNFKPWMHP